ncbi:hypothetical protein [Knoellia remsis]|uniref:hypothetical protein n=1 Tax=Knoellia remsis TaxID=407159 RepID=UPI000D080D2C|nr:hypothetical protein [Knoellia remsis]
MALGVSALSFLIALSVGVLFAADRVGSGGDEVWGYDAGLPAWGEVELTPTGAVTDRTFTDSVETAVVDVLEDGTPVEDLLCEALPAPRKDTVTSCGAVIDGFDTTIVVLFLDDNGGFMATLY